MPDLVQRYLRQTRLGIGVRSQTLADIYEEHFRRIVGGLDFAEGTAPRLHVVHSLSALPETLLTGDKRTVVYDQHLGQTFNRLTDFVLSGWPPNLVLKWAFKHLAIDLAAVGGFTEAHVALMLHQTWPGDGRPPPPGRESLVLRGLLVGAQEYFVIAHECAHASLAGPGGVAALETFGELVDKTVALREERLANLPADVVADNRRRFAEDEHRAIRSGSINYSVLSADVEAMEDLAPDFTAGLQEWIADRPHLYEELLCDSIATELTLERFAGDLPINLVLGNVLHAMHNLTSLELVRQCARELVGAPDSQGIEIAARKSVWRDLMHFLHGEEIRSAPGGDTFVEVTEAHAEAVGDQVVFTLPAEFANGLARLRPQLSDPARSEEAVREALEHLTSEGEPEVVVSGA